jgi:hypothetical protein
MTSTRTHHLMEGWLDGGIEDAEFTELEAALLESAEMRREFWRRASLHGLIREAVKIAGPLPLPVGQPTHRIPRRAWFRGGLAGSVAAMLLFCGLCIGSLVTSIAFALAGLRASDARALDARGLDTVALDPRAVVIHEEGFERPPVPRQDFIPRRSDVWSGDETEVVGAEWNIVPRSGRRMLRFVSGHPRGAHYEGKGAEIWRIIDLKAARAAAGSGDVRINLYGYFNGVDPGGERLRIWLTAVATDVPPADLAGLWNERFLYEDTSPASLEVAQSRDAIDADPATWERIATSLVVPRRARFVLLHCSAVLPAMPGEAERLPRYYADDISVVVTPVATSNNDPEARRPPGG